MCINSVSPVSFKSYVPVYHKKLNKETGEFELVTDPKELRKCQRFVVSNLNHTAKNNSQPDFVKFFAANDVDYRYSRVVHSVYDDNLPVVHMATGRDVDVLKEYAKNVGRTKSDSLYTYGTTKSQETRKATNDYFNSAKRYLFSRARRIKSPQGDKLGLSVYFEPIYKRNGELKAFKYIDADFIKHS